VVADNCTDGTAEAALAQGAHVYRRFHNTRIGKGYALDFLIQNIYGDFGKQYFDGFFVFDADNLLAENYITEMNKIFSEGFRIVTSYRNSKNYGDNWISAG
ncbi:MAG TPA: N-acetylglucosaminyltransferase, partial [Clostridiales bacterium]|nr:N-acetylglucosaminyltransferase [Clostridiales bacterium]